MVENSIDRRGFLRTCGVAGAGLALAGAGAAGCAAPSTQPHESAAPPPSSPPPDVEVLVLGTAQDGGIPHLACRCPRCRATAEGALPGRCIAAIAILDRPSGSCFLVDATPDIRPQIARLLAAPGMAERPTRAPVSGIFLTHAHIGHYLGLAFLGRESIHARAIPVHASARMGEFLRRNAPFELLVRLGNIDLREIHPGERVALTPRVAVVPFAVPHREEYTDTLGFRIEGPARALVYVSDIDAWDDASAAHVSQADGALVDGTFFSLDELPGRPREEIPHPPMRETMERFAEIARRGTRVIFTHLNHSNPAVDPASAEARAVREAGFEIAHDGLSIAL